MLHLHRWLGCALAFCATSVNAQQGNDPKRLLEPIQAEVRFTDDSVMRMVVLQEQLEVITKYGKLKVPTRDIQSIDFGVHLPPGLQQKVTLAIDQLGGDNYKSRETAFKNLVTWGPSAFPQVTAAIKSDDPETIKRSMMALDKIRAKHAARNLRLREEDMIVTPSFSVVGRVTTPIMQAKNDNFGDLDLKVCTLRSVRWLNASHETEVSLTLPILAVPRTSGWTPALRRERLAADDCGERTVDLWPQRGGGTVYTTTPKGYRGAVDRPAFAGHAAGQDRRRRSRLRHWRTL